MGKPVPVTAARKSSTNATEQRMIKAVVAGERLDLAGADPVDETAMRSWGPARTVRASVIRDIVLGRSSPDPDPHGLRLRGARISGRVDLDNITSDLVVELQDCFLPDGVTAHEGGLGAFVLEGCLVEQPAGSTEPAINAARLTARRVLITGSTVTVDSTATAITMAGAQLGAVDCSGSTIRNTSGGAFDGDNLRVDTNLSFRGLKASAHSTRGGINLIGAHIGQLHCDGAEVHNTAGPALNGDNLQVDRSLSLAGGTLTAGSEAGAMNLPNARIGQLLCDGAKLTNTAGPALNGDNLQVDRSVFLRYGFTATATSRRGTIHLLGARIGQLECDGARLHNTAGPALNGDHLRVDRYVFLRKGFEATAVTGEGAIHLLGAHIGQLECDSAELRNTAGPALNAGRIQVDHGVHFRNGFRATGGGDLAVMKLSNARIAGGLWLDLDQVQRAGPGQGALVDLDRTTYFGVPQPQSLSRWLQLFRSHTGPYAAHPYQQLAAAHRAAGHDREVRMILMAQRRDQIDRRVITGWDRFWARLTGFTLGFGYQPWRALCCLLAVLAVAITLALTLGHHGGLKHTSRSTTPNGSCSAVEQVGVGLDLGTPLLKTGARDFCAPTATATGQSLTIAGWLLQILAWAFATLFVAGFTGAVRKT